MRPTQPFYDVVVVGARPAGAGTALLLSRLGHRVLVLERSAPGSDTLSTHALMRGGVLQLRRWGLLDRVVGTRTPAVHRVTFGYGDDVVPIDLPAPLYAPRRTVLDAVLAESAAAAGAEVLHGVHVDGVLRDGDGRVVGVHGRDADRRPFAVGATLVVGADGLRSTIAREVDALVTWRGAAASASLYAHLADVPTDGYEWLYAPGLAAGVIPTTDGHVCVFAGLPSPRFTGTVRRDLVGTFDDVLHAISPEVADRVASGRPLGPVRGFPGVPGILRRPHGDGWALVGDAGAFRDPLSTHGISDALRDAELLARAVHDGLTHQRPMAASLAEYERTRDLLVRPVLAAVEPVASFRWTLQELPGLHRALSDAMKPEVAHLESLAPIREGVLVA